MPKIVRLTLFKIPDETTVKEAVKSYSTLAQDAKKVNSVPDSCPRISPLLVEYHMHTRTNNATEPACPAGSSHSAPVPLTRLS
jgi:hypothetical protein